jgi:hypothetical protein
MTVCEHNISMYICLKANLLELETKHVLPYRDKLYNLYIFKMPIVDMMVGREGMTVASFSTVFAFFILKTFSRKMSKNKPKTTTRFRNKESTSTYTSFSRGKVNYLAYV